MSHEYDIRPYRSGDEASILSGFNRVFREVCGPEYVDRSLEYWQWEFEQCPFGHRTTVGVTEDGVVAAQFAGIVQPMATSFGSQRFVHMVDSFALSEHRAGLKRPGLFVTTALPCFTMSKDLGDALMFGYPVRVAERIGSRYLGYTLVRTVNYLCRDASAGSIEVPTSITVEDVSEIPREVDALFAKLEGQRQCWIRRDHAYLEWRYVQIPTDDYRVCVARRAGALVGLAVVRPVHELVPACTAIADWLVADGDDEVIDALLAQTTRIAREHGRTTVTSVFPDPAPETVAFRDRGFEVLPSADLLERRLHHVSHDERFTTEWLTDHWWYTLGDSDLV